MVGVTLTTGDAKILEMIKQTPWCTSDHIMEGVGKYFEDMAKLNRRLKTFKNLGVLRSVRSEWDGRVKLWALTGVLRSFYSGSRVFSVNPVFPERTQAEMNKENDKRLDKYMEMWRARQYEKLMRHTGRGEAHG